MIRSRLHPAERTMAHEIAKLILEHADSLAERTEAVRTALSLGMPLSEIEEYLDWIDHVRPPASAPPKDENGEPDSS